MTKTKREIWQKEKGHKEIKKTHRSSVRRERIAHDISIMGHGMLSSKAIWAISIDHPREVWRINWIIDSRFPLLQFLTLEVMTNKERKKKREEKEIEHILD